MASPRRFVIRMILFLVAVGLVCGLLAEPLHEAFIANMGLNGLIIGVLLLGIVYNFRQTLMLFPEVDWIENYRKSFQSIIPQKPPKLLSSMATMLGDRTDGMSLSAQSMRSLLDGIASRLDESRDLSRYNIGLLIFLGLLGTFWGLLETVGSIRNVIDNLSVSVGDFNIIFNNLKLGLSAPLSGMGTAFSSSLFGLAGSLILGFLDLQASQSQNRFYNDLEEWLSGLTRLSSGGRLTDVDQSVPAYVQALLEQTADSLGSLQQTLKREGESNIQTNKKIGDLTEILSKLGDQMRTEQTLMNAFSEQQGDLKSAIEMMLSAKNISGFDQVTQDHIRNIDLYMERLIEELSSSRTDLTKQISSEIKLLARTIAAGNKNTG